MKQYLSLLGCVGLVSTQTALCKPDAEYLRLFDSSRFPEVNFQDVTFEEGLDFLRLRASELGYGSNLRNKYTAVSLAHDETIAPQVQPAGKAPRDSFRPGRISYAARNVSLGQILTEMAKQAGVDLYLTSIGLVICPPGVPPFPNPQAVKGEIWGTLHKVKRPTVEEKLPVEVVPPNGP